LLEVFYGSELDDDVIIWQICPQFCHLLDNPELLDKAHSRPDTYCPLWLWFSIESTSTLEENAGRVELLRGTDKLDGCN
jgi:hypothetical protein